jgi:hypothetical protein
MVTIHFFLLTVIRLSVEPHNWSFPLCTQQLTANIKFTVKAIRTKKSLLATHDLLTKELLYNSYNMVTDKQGIRELRV